MSRQRRNFSAKFKSDLVIELLKGENLHWEGTEVAYMSEFIQSHGRSLSQS